VPRPLCTHFSFKVKMTKYNVSNLHGYIFTDVQNSHDRGQPHQGQGLPSGTVGPGKQGSFWA